MNLALGVERRRRGVEPVDVGEQHQQVGAHHRRHARGQPVVVAVADFGGRHRVVLVDDRHRLHLEQRGDRGARVEIAAALLGVAERQQDLAGFQAALPSASDQAPASAICPTAAAAWLSSSFSARLPRPRMVRPSAMAPEETTRISAPPAASTAMSSASEASQSRFRPLVRSTSSAEPILTVMRRYFFSDCAVIAIGPSASRREQPSRFARFGHHRHQRAQHRLDAFAGDRRQQHRRAAGGALQRRDLLLALVGIEHVDLAQRHDLGLFGQPVAIGFELGAHGLVGLARIFLLRRNQMQQHARALDMAEEAVADADAFMRAFDQAGNVGDDEFARVDAGDAEAGMQRGEGIVGDLRLGRGDRRQEGRLAGIGQADQAGIGDQLQPQPDRQLLAGQAGIGAARRLVGRGLEMLVAEAAIAALGQPEALADLGQVADQRLVVLVEDLRAGRHLQRHVGALGAGHVAAHAVDAGLGLEMLLVAIVDQRVQPVDGLQPDIAAAAAVAAVRPAELDEFLAPERHRAGAAVAGADIDLGLIEKFHRITHFCCWPCGFV